MKYQGEDLKQFSKQIEFTLQKYSGIPLDVTKYNNIILSGLGGSGIAARIVKSYFMSVSPLPIEVISDYALPAYASDKTLAIMSSYSGNTEETLMMYDDAKNLKADIIVITTGGMLAERALADGYPLFYAEKGFQPRMALGYSLTYLQLIFGDLFGRDTRVELKKAATELVNVDKFLQNGKDIFAQFNGELNKKITIVSDYFTNPIALRFCQQIQENAKAEAFLSELPEANHNVIESYVGKMDSIIIFIQSNIHPRTDLRFNFLESILTEKGNNIINIKVDKTSLVDFLSVIYALDWVSLLLAEAKGLNSSLIPNINALKEHLGKN